MSLRAADLDRDSHGPALEGIRDPDRGSHRQVTVTDGDGDGLLNSLLRIKGGTGTDSEPAAQ